MSFKKEKSLAEGEALVTALTSMDNKIIEEAKKLIIFDSELTYAERNALGIFYSKIEKGKSVKEAVPPMLNTFSMIESGGSQGDLSPSVKKYFELILQYYNIPEKKKGYIYGSGGGLTHRFSTKEMIIMFLIIVVGLPLAFFLNYLLHK